MTVARSPKVIRRGTGRHGSCLPNKRRWEVRNADCLKALPKLQANSIDAIVTDPPYGLEFMGKEWDSFRSDDPGTNRNRGERAGSQGMADGAGEGNYPAREKIAVAYGGGKRPDTSRCTGCGKRDQFRNKHACGPSARWVREPIDQGFPKSLNVAAAIDKADGHVPRGRAIPVASTHLPSGRYAKEKLTANPVEPYKARSRAAATWEGWGTALKPAWEPIVIARKPPDGTIAENVCRHGTGALHIDRCRIAFQSCGDERESRDKNRHADFGSGPRKNRIYGRDERTRGNYDAPGRWPANVVLSHSKDCRRIGQTCMRSNCHHHAARGAGGVSTTGHRGQKRLAERSSAEEFVGCWECSPDCAVRILDEQSSVSPSRFYYSAKASRTERDAGLEAAGNIHPTVKPIGLMRWLVRLITPPGGTVLDPFAGSGTTGAAVVLEGAHFLGIERDPTYVPIARARIKHWARSAERRSP